LFLSNVFKLEAIAEIKDSPLRAVQLKAIHF
jgi:hypothetical protein